MLKLSAELRKQGISSEEIGNITSDVAVLRRRYIQQGVDSTDAMWLATKKLTGLDIQPSE